MKVKISKTDCLDNESRTSKIQNEQQSVLRSLSPKPKDRYPTALHIEGEKK